MNPARFRWGLFFIQIGIFLILININYIDYYNFEELFNYFPLIFIAVGIEKIFTKSRLQFIAYLTSIALFFGGLYIVYAQNITGISNSFFSESRYTVDFDPSVKKLKAVFNLGETDLKIRESGDELFYGRFDKFTSKPKVSITDIDGLKQIELTRGSGSLFGGIVKIDVDEANEWYVRMTDKIPVDLECYGENSYIHLNLASTYLENLYLDADNAELYVKLGDLSPRAKVQIFGSDSNLKLRLPENIGIKIEGIDKKNYLLRIGFTETRNGYFVNDGFDTLTNQIELDIDDRIDNFVLDFF